MKSRHCLPIVALGVLLAGCSNTLINTRVTPDAALKGIRWSESRQYDVYVYRGTAKLGDVPGEPVFLYFGTHDLLDSVNGVVIDAGRPKWELNYEALPFSDGGLEVTFGEDGAFKSVKTSGKPGTAGALNAATTVVKTKDDIKAEELADLQRQVTYSRPRRT